MSLLSLGSSARSTRTPAAALSLAERNIAIAEEALTAAKSQGVPGLSGAIASLQKAEASVSRASPGSIGGSYITPGSARSARSASKRKTPSPVASITAKVSDLPPAVKIAAVAVAAYVVYYLWKKNKKPAIDLY